MAPWCLDRAIDAVTRSDRARVPSEALPHRIKLFESLPVAVLIQEAHLPVSRLDKAQSPGEPAPASVQPLCWTTTEGAGAPDSDSGRDASARLHGGESTTC